MIAWRRQGQNKQLDAYKCSICGFWHLGNSADPLRKMDRINQLLNKVLREPPSQPLHTES